MSKNAIISLVFVFFIIEKRHYISRLCFFNNNNNNNNSNNNNNNNNNKYKTLLKLHNKILTEIKRKPKEHSSKLLSFKISFSIKHGISI